MKKSRFYKIALILYTRGIDYDDRIRKEILSIKRMYSNINFKIFALDDKNRKEEGLTSYGIPYCIPYLKTRDKYASATHTIQKAWDFYSTIKNDLKEFDAIWCADIEPFFFILMNFGKPIVWDLHELPLPFMGNFIKKIFFKYLERKCSIVIHANNDRLKYLKENGYIRSSERHFYLRNYPQFEEIDLEYDETYQNFVKWKGNSKCVYLQGLNGINRADIESIESVLRMGGLKAVVVGNIQPARMKVFIEKFGNKVLEEKVFFTGHIKQLKTPQYIKQCFVSLVFYKNLQPNNWYCEPNRMYQNVINGNPVVVGNNPSMKEFVEANGFGISVDTDGSDVEKIVTGLKKLMSNYSQYKKNITNYSGKLVWSSQDCIISEIIEKLLA